MQVRAGRGDHVARKCAWLLVAVPALLLALCEAPFGPPRDDFVLWVLGAGMAWMLWVVLNQWMVVTLEFNEHEFVTRSSTWPPTRHRWEDLVYVDLLKVGAHGVQRGRANIYSESYKTGTRLILVENIDADAASWLLRLLQKRIDATARHAPSWKTLELTRDEDKLVVEYDSRIHIAYWIIPFVIGSIVVFWGLKGLGVLAWILVAGGMTLPVVLLQKYSRPEGRCRLELNPSSLEYRRGRVQIALDHLPEGLDVSVHDGALVGYGGVVVARAFPNLSEAKRRAIRDALRSFAATHLPAPARLATDDALDARVVRDETAW